MKKIIVMSVAFFLAFSLTAFAGGPPKGNAKPAPAPARHEVKHAGKPVKKDKMKRGGKKHMGKKNGWNKNPNNPHNPNCTNPGKAGQHVKPKMVR